MIQRSVDKIFKVPKKENIIVEHHLPHMAKSGIFMHHYVNEDLLRADNIHEPHRDTHALFNFAIQGSCNFLLDFKKYTLTAPVIVMVFPGQVHYIDHCKNVTGWSIAFDPLLMDPALAQTLQCIFQAPLPIDPDSSIHRELVQLLQLLKQFNSQASGNEQTAAFQGLFVSLLQWTAGSLKVTCPETGKAKDRSRAIELHFKTLLQKHFVRHKKPGFYSEQMNISTAHLGDTIKSMTGKSVTAHIQEMSLLDAKRYLYKTDLSIKEICFLVGYDDPVHFGKLFKKFCGVTPLEFRKQIRE